MASYESKIKSLVERGLKLDVIRTRVVSVGKVLRNEFECKLSFGGVDLIFDYANGSFSPKEGVVFREGEWIGDRFLNGMWYSEKENRLSASAQAFAHGMIESRKPSLSEVMFELASDACLGNESYLGFCDMVEMGGDLAMEEHSRCIHLKHKLDKMFGEELLFDLLNTGRESE